MNRLNKSFLYLFPLIYRELIDEKLIDPDIFYKSNWLNNFVNTYCLTNIPNQFVIQLYLTDISEEILSIFEKSSMFAVLTKKDDKISIVINVPKKALDSYKYFLIGKYSFFPQDDKQVIIKFCNIFLFPGKDKESKAAQMMVYDILYKTPERAKLLMEKFGVRESDWHPSWENSSVISVEEETFNN